MTDTAEKPPPRPQAFQRLIARGARLLARGMYRSVEVDNAEPGWSWHPAIIVANHPTGFSDPALLLGLLERSPRFLAKATLWNTPGVGWVLGRLGAIPIYRAQDGATERNAEMFAAAFDALHQGYLIALFPEGGVSDTPSLGPIKTGAARLALGAHEAGVAGLLIVPVGIHFEDKAGLRKRAYVQVGDVIEMDCEISGITQDVGRRTEDRSAAVMLTEEIERRLRAAAPDYSTDEEASTLAFAAGVALSQPGTDDVSFADRQQAAAQLSRVARPQREAAANATVQYRDRLAVHRLRDRDVLLAGGGARLRRRLAWLLVLLVALFPFTLAGVAMNLVPLLGLLAAMRSSPDAMTAATVRMVSAVAAFLIMWAVWATWAWNLWDWRMGLIVFIAAPVYGAVALFTIDRTVEWWHDVMGRRRAVRVGAGLAPLLAERRALVTTIEEVMV